MKAYLCGMICGSSAFVPDSFPQPDEYAEITQRARFVGGETGICATVPASLGAEVRIDGTHIGRSTAQLTRDFYAGRRVDLTTLSEVHAMIASGGHQTESDGFPLN